MKKLILALSVAGLLSSSAIAGNEHANAATQLTGGLNARSQRVEAIPSPHFVYDVTDVKPNGKIRWHVRYHNLVTTEGKNNLIDCYFKITSCASGWYLGLKGTGTAVIADTLASHASWSEVTPYSGNRPAITFGTSSSGSNTATAVSYAVTGTATVAGSFVSSVNTGTSGKLYSAGDFAASRSVLSGDTLNVTLTVSY